MRDACRGRLQVSRHGAGMSALPMPPSVIHKFSLDIRSGTQTLPLSEGAQVIFVGGQAPSDGTVQLWVRRYHSTGVIPGERRFEIYGTGQPIPGKREYVGSVIDGPFVWHVMEVRA